MNTTLAIVTAGGPVLVAVTALLLNYYGFQLMGKRIDEVNRRLELIEADLKEFFRDITRLKEKAGL